MGMLHWFRVFQTTSPSSPPPHLWEEERRSTEALHFHFLLMLKYTARALPVSPCTENFVRCWSVLCCTGRSNSSWNSRYSVQWTDYVSSTPITWLRPILPFRSSFSWVQTGPWMPFCPRALVWLISFPIYCSVLWLQQVACSQSLSLTMQRYLFDYTCPLFTTGTSLNFVGIYLGECSFLSVWLQKNFLLLYPWQKRPVCKGASQWNWRTFCVFCLLKP